MSGEVKQIKIKFFQCDICRRYKEIGCSREAQERIIDNDIVKTFEGGKVIARVASHEVYYPRAICDECEVELEAGGYGGKQK